MATITISSTTTAIAYQGTASTLELRIYAGTSFIASDGTIIPASPQVYKTATCTISTGIVTIPAITLPSTTDSLTNQNARYAVAALYETGGASPVFVLLDNFAVTHVYTSTTWQTLTNQRTAMNRRRVEGSYTVTETDAAIAAYGYSRADIDALELNDLADVAITTPQTYDVPAYNAVTGDWENQPNQGGWALSFDSTKGHHVNCGYKWQPNTDYFSCFYEAWVYVDNTNSLEYVFSDGYGGAHNLLFGVTGSTRYQITGNFSNGVDNNTYGTFVTFAPGEWHHIAVSYSQQENSVIAYIDGVPGGKITFTGTERNTLSNAGTGILFVGGSDHSNFNGLIKCVRGYEFADATYPVPYAAFTTPKNNIAFRPEKNFRGTLRRGDDFITPTFLMDFSQFNRGTIPDLVGQNHGKRVCNIGEATHDTGVWEGKSVFTDTESNYAESNLPQFVRSNFAQPAYSGTAPGTIPSGAILYDDFRRQDVTFAWSTTHAIVPGAARTGQTPTLAVGYVGIQNECLFDAGDTLQTIRWECSTANQDVTLTRPTIAAYADAAEVFGLLARYTNDSNYLWAYCAAGNWNVVKRVAGTNTTLASGALGGLASYTTLRLVANGDNAYFYVDGTQLGGTINIASTGSGTKAGINSYGNPLTRYDSILVVAP